MKRYRVDAFRDGNHGIKYFDTLDQAFKAAAAADKVGSVAFILKKTVVNPDLFEVIWQYDGSMSCDENIFSVYFRGNLSSLMSL